MGKRKIDPETGKRVKFPSDFKERIRKERKPRTTEQNAARRVKGMGVGRLRPNKHTKVYLRQCVRHACTDDVVCRDPR